jgi:hypothetical protein
MECSTKYDEALNSVIDGLLTSIGMNKPNKRKGKPKRYLCMARVVAMKVKHPSMTVKWLFESVAKESRTTYNRVRVNVHEAVTNADVLKGFSSKMAIDWCYYHILSNM